MNRDVCEHFNQINHCQECEAVMYFNIDKTLNIDAEIEKSCKYRISHLWDECGNCPQERLTVQRWVNVKSAIEFLLKDNNAVSVKTECGLIVYRGKCGLANENCGQTVDTKQGQTRFVCG